MMLTNVNINKIMMIMTIRVLMIVALIFMMINNPFHDIATPILASFLMVICLYQTPFLSY